ncbi:MAG TPA: response regulator [Burkholderiales bacterium]|nr:response regulator [Burkholderiales bacterium]
MLIVDDDVDAADSVALMLRAMGHEVEVAHDGRSGIETSRITRPDVVLLDIAMPEMTGYDAAREIRRFLGAGVRIIAVTGYGQDEDRRRSLEAGFDQHIVKPLDPDLLKRLTG